MILREFKYFNCASEMLSLVMQGYHQVRQWLNLYKNCYDGRWLVCPHLCCGLCL